MDIVGHFQADQQEYRLGQPISVTLYMKNTGPEAVYLWVPRGRDRGLQIKVEQGHNFKLKDMSGEPEMGLLPEIPALPGEIAKQEFLLSKRVTLSEPAPTSLSARFQLRSLIAARTKNPLDLLGREA